MPGWHEANQPLVDEGRLVILGVVQEQHAERAQLYQQWRHLSWPIVQDAFNVLQIKAVPLAVAIDEQGIVRSHRANPNFVAQWVDEAGDDASTTPSGSEPPALTTAVPDAAALVDKSASEIAELAAKMLKQSDVSAARANFEFGVAHRMRFDQHGDPADFQAAIDFWSQALAHDPNQYIYRRRIQQYGARLGKPYPFYDWVAQARQDILQRGDTPIALQVELSGAEIAQPTRQFETTANSQTHPDPESKIQADTEDLIDASVIVVPRKAQPGKSVRVHVLLQPGAKAKWNNEAEPTQFWVHTPPSGSVSQNLLQSDMPEEAESTETRRFEFEIHLPETSESTWTLPAFALINVCHRETGVCTYLRKNIPIEVEIAR